MSLTSKIEFKKSNVGRPELTALSSHLSLFLSAFLAATILPGSSEVMLAGLVLLDPASTATLLMCATVGNTAGAAVNWYLGRSLMHFVGRRWFPVSSHRIERASSFFNRYGSWPLLLAWLPVVGDPLTVAAGMLRIRFVVFLPLVAIGKAVRYVFVIWGMELARGVT